MGSGDLHMTTYPWQKTSIKESNVVECMKMKTEDRRQIKHNK